MHSIKKYPSRVVHMNMSRQEPGKKSNKRVLKSTKIQLKIMGSNQRSMANKRPFKEVIIYFWSKNQEEGIPVRTKIISIIRMRIKAISIIICHRILKVCGCSQVRRPKKGSEMVLKTVTMRKQPIENILDALESIRKPFKIYKSNGKKE